MKISIKKKTISSIIKFYINEKVMYTINNYFFYFAIYESKIDSRVYI